MDARVITGQVRSGMEGEAIFLTWEMVLPVAREQRGYRGLVSLFDWDTGKTMAISLWESSAELVGGDTSGSLREQLARIGAVMEGPTSRETFSVEVCETMPGEAAVARVLTARLNSAAIDESAAIAREAIQNVSRRQHGFRGVLALVERSTGKDYTISLWATDADRQAGEQSGYFREQLAKVGAFLEGPVTRESFEVVVADLPA